MNHDELGELKASLAGKILLGHDPRTGRRHHLSLEDLKETSVHVVGAAGFGKSYFLRHWIDTFVARHLPFAVIDPHQELYDYALWRLRGSSVRPERIIPIDPSEPDYAVGFNPLHCGLTDPAEAASMVVEAVQKAWGADSFNATPRLEGILRGMFRLLIENGLTLLEAYDFLEVENTAMRKALRERVSDEHLRKNWAQFEKWSTAEKLARTESSLNRLHRFLQTPGIPMMLAQTRNTLNLQHVLDDGKILLANLRSTVGETQRLLGALLINGIFHAAKRRNSRRRKDYFVIVDEFGEFATRDVANSLDQLRKFGCHLILAHQRMPQLQREDPDVLSAVMTNAKIKVVFGGLERSDAERMAKELFTADVHGDNVKHRVVQTKFRPEQSTFEVITESESDTEGDTRSEGRSSGSGKSTAESRIEPWREDDDERHLTESVSESSTDTASQGWTRSSTYGTSRSRVPITVHKEFQEETGRQYRSLDEEWEQRIARVHSLDKREALVKIYNRPVIHIRTPEVKDLVEDSRLVQMRQRVLRACPHVKPIEEIQLEIETRKTEVAQLIEAAEPAERLRKVRSFRE